MQRRHICGRALTHPSRTGYHRTALLARLSAFVWSIERWADIAEVARKKLFRQGITNVAVIVGDGSEGLPQQSPFEAILVSAAFPEVPQPLKEQLAPGGRLVQPIGFGGNEAVIIFEKGTEGFTLRQAVTRARFVRLYGRYGFPTA